VTISRFIEFNKLAVNKNGIFYSANSEDRAGFKPKDLYTECVMHAVNQQLSEYPRKKSVLESFPEMDPDFKEENIVEAIKRIEQEKETLKDEIKELQAAVFKLQSKCK
jgi:hypothetical protein